MNGPAAVLLLLALVAGSGIAPEPQAGPIVASVDPAALVVPLDAPELQRPALRARLEAGPHDYFRFINARFTALLCQRFMEQLTMLPDVTLHGDAHLEQYAVSERGRGLSDFDDASSGPAFIDLARFSVSIRLALRERGWDEAEPLLAAFLEGYARALREPATVAPEPAVARRLSAGFDRDRLACLARAESLMERLPANAAPDDATREKVALLLGEAAHLPAAFFRVKDVGALRLGIGSASDEKYLFRVEGRSAALDDDVILEVKEVRPPAALSCIRSDPGPTRILVSQERLAYTPFQYAGALAFEGRAFWFHAWPDNYAELDIRGSLESLAELREVVYDVGVQLGRGHPRRASSAEARKLRRALLSGLPRVQLAALSARLAETCADAWLRFRAATPAAPRPP